MAKFFINRPIVAMVIAIVTVIVGLVAMRVGKKLSWDATSIKCSNAPEAEKYLKESYRAGWEIPS